MDHKINFNLEGKNPAEYLNISKERENFLDAQLHLMLDLISNKNHGDECLTCPGAEDCEFREIYLSLEPLSGIETMSEAFNHLLNVANNLEEGLYLIQGFITTVERLKAEKNSRMNPIQQMLEEMGISGKAVVIGSPSSNLEEMILKARHNKSFPQA